MDSWKEFLQIYSKHMEWNLVDLEAIKRHVCENYGYSPKCEVSRRIIFIAYGWIWGKTGDEIEANAACFFLEKELKEMYSVIAKENGWPDD